MSIGLFIFSLLALQGVCWIAAKRSARGISTKFDYFLSGQNVGFFPLMMTFAATQVGGGLMLGAAQEASRYGWWVLLYPLGQVLGMVCLSMGIGRRLASFGVPTVAQIFEVYYGSPWLKRIASLLSMVSLFLILVAQMLASKSFMLSLGVDNMWLFMGAWGALIIYTAMGGLKGVISTDLIQATFFLAVLGAAFWVGFGKGGDMLAGEQGSLSWGKMSGWLLMPLCFAFLEQDMGQRCFAAKSTRVLNRAAFGSAMVIFLACLIPIYFGTVAASLGVNGSGGSSVLMGAISASTSPAITALVGCAVLAAILSTANSLLNAISSNLSQDFAFSQRLSLSSSQLLTGIIGLLAIGVGFCFDNVVDLMIQAYELSVCTVFVPLLAALFSKSKGDWRSAAVSMLCGAIAFFFFRIYPLELPKEIIALGCSFGGFAAMQGVAKIWPSRKRELA